MSYDPGIPNASNSPALFPVQSQTNFGRLKTLVEADHQFNNAAASDDGFHKLVRMIPPVPGPSGALNGYGRLYCKEVSGVQQMFYMDDSGQEYQITPSYAGAGIIAAVNFNGLSGVPTIRSQLNVSSVTRPDNGRYIVNFTNPIANNNYIVSVTGMNNTAGGGEGAIFGFVRGNATYSNSVQTTSLAVGFGRDNNSAVNVLMGNVIVYQV